MNSTIELLTENSAGMLDIHFIQPDLFSVQGGEKGEYACELFIQKEDKYILAESESCLSKLSSVNRKALLEKFKKYNVKYHNKKLYINCDSKSLLFAYKTLCMVLELVEEADVEEERQTESNIELLKKTCGGMFKFKKYDEGRLKIIYSDFKFVCDILVTEIEDDKTFMLTCDGSLANKVESLDSETREKRLEYVKKKYGVVFNRGYFMTIVPLKQITSEFIELIQAITYVLK